MGFVSEKQRRYVMMKLSGKQAQAKLIPPALAQAAVGLQSPREEWGTAYDFDAGREPERVTIRRGRPHAVRIWRPGDRDYEVTLHSHSRHELSTQRARNLALLQSRPSLADVTNFIKRYPKTQQKLVVTHRGILRVRMVRQDAKKRDWTEADRSRLAAIHRQLEDRTGATRDNPDIGAPGMQGRIRDYHRGWKRAAEACGVTWDVLPTGVATRRGIRVQVIPV